MASPAGAVVKPYRKLSKLVLAGGQISEIGLPLLRSIALAHMLDQVTFGIALALSAVASIVEISSDLGFDRSAIRVAGDDAARDRNTLHSLSILRGLVIGLLLMACGPLFAWILHSSQASYAFSALGICSMIRGFIHLGVKEAMQKHSFWREGLSSIVTQTTWTAVTLWVAFVWRSYDSMLIGLIGGQIAYVAVTHLVCLSKPYRLAWSKPFVQETLKFGLPLLPNGMASAATSLLDRIIVGSFLGVAPMALYTTTIMASTLPRGAISRYLNTIWMPVFFNAGREGARERRLFEVWFVTLCSVAFCFSACYIGSSKILLPIIFGRQFEPSQILLALIGISAFFKFYVFLPIPPALADGDTRFLLFGTFAGMVSLVSGLAGIALVRTPEGFVGGTCLGDIAMAFLLLLRCAKKYRFDLPVGIIATFVSLFLLVAEDVYLDVMHTAVGINIAATIGTLAAFSAAAYCLVRSQHLPVGSHRN